MSQERRFTFDASDHILEHLRLHLARMYCMYQRAAGVREMGGPISMTASTSTAQLNGRDGEATADLPWEERYQSAGRGIGAIGRSRLRALSQHLAIPHHEHLQYLITILGMQLFRGKPCPLARVSSWQ